MRIATYNINGIGSRLPALLEYLEEKKPDVACLQELKAPQERFPLAEINAAGYGALWQGQKAWNGVAQHAFDVQRRDLPGCRRCRGRSSQHEGDGGWTGDRAQEGIDHNVCLRS